MNRIPVVTHKIRLHASQEHILRNAAFFEHLYKAAEPFVFLIQMNEKINAFYIYIY